MNGTSPRAWHTRVLALIVGAALAVGVVGSGASTAFAQTPDEVSPAEVVEESGQAVEEPAENSEAVSEAADPKAVDPEATDSGAAAEQPAASDPAPEGEPAPAEETAAEDDVETLTLDPYTPDDTKIPSSVNRATGTCPVVSQEFGFGKGTSYTTSDRPEGTVLGYDGVPDDLKTANQHFVYYPIPDSSTEVEHKTGFQETVSLSKYTNGDSGDFGLAINSAGKVYSWGGNRYGQLGQGSTAASGVPFTVNPALVSSLPASATFVQVSAGSGHALALSKDGDIYAWGSIDNYGQLGQGNTTVITGGQSKALKVNVPGVKFKQISAGWDYSLAVDTLGNAWAWGKSNNGATAGAGGGIPSKISGLSGVNMVSAGYQHSGAITTSGDLYMWGYQVNGRLGNGQTSGIGSVQKIGTMKWKQVSAANASTYAVTQTGELYAWGYNAGYRLGLGDTTDRSTPTFTYSSGVKQVSGSQYAAVFVTNGGDVYTAGSNNNVQLGAAGGVESTVYQRWTGPQLRGASEVSMGDIAAGAKAGNVATWGLGMQLGNGDLGVSKTPSTIGGAVGTPAKPWVTITTTTSMTDTEARGSKIVFGDQNALNTPAGWQLAKNIDVVTVSGKKYLRGDVPAHNAGPTPVNLWWNDGKNQWLLTGCYTYNIALKIGSAPNPAPSSESATVTTQFWDPQEAPYAGASTVTMTIQQLGGTGAQLTQVGGSGVTNLPFASGSVSAEVKLATPQPAANNGAGKWKYSTAVIANVAAPSGPVVVNRNTVAGDVQFYDDDSGITPPPPGPEYTCDVEPKWLNADKIAGTVLGYGGTRTGEVLKVPVPDPGLDIVQVSMGAGASTTAIPDPFENRPFPGQGSLYTVTSLGTHTLYLDRAGNVWGLGLNDYGQVGNGSTTDITTPVKVLGPSADATMTTTDKVTRISAGGSHSVAVTESGKLYQWGFGFELGIAGLNNTLSTPVELPVAGVDFKDVSAGGQFTIALSTAGKVFTWGRNGSSQLGRGAADSLLYPKPQLVSTISGLTVLEISAGATHGLASTGTRVYGWGNGVRSGNGVTNGGSAPPPQPTPYNIPAFSGKIIKQIEATPDNSYVLTSEALYAWGSREWGLSMMPAEWAGIGTGAQYSPRIGDLPAGLTGKDITGVFGGKGYTYLTTTSDDVYAFGNNRRADKTSLIGDLGTEESYWDFSYLEVPAKVPGLSGKGITQIAGGGRGNTLAYPVLATSRIAFTADGTSYGWGGNQVGQLGKAQPADVETYVPYQLTIGGGVPVESGTIYFGDPKKGLGVDRSAKVDVSKADIITEGGKQYFLVKVPEHVVGGVEVYTEWDGATTAQEQIGCYDYQLSLYISPDPDPQFAGLDILVTAYVGAGEAPLTGDAVVDISIPAVGNELRLVPGESLTRLALNNGEATTKVRLRDDWPTPTEANGDWKYPDSALAWIPSSAASTSLVSDTNAQVVSEQALTPKPWVWFTPPLGHEIYLWKTGESTNRKVVGMSGSEWQIYEKSATIPNTPDFTKPVDGFKSEVTNPNTSAADRQKGWFTATLAPGDYWLLETKAPKGFQLMAEPVQFRVHTDGRVQALTGRSGYFAATTDWDLNSWDETTLVVRDPGATPLPKSGSEPWQWILLFGVLLLGTAGVLVVRRFLPEKTPAG